MRKVPNLDTALDVIHHPGHRSEKKVLVVTKARPLSDASE